MSHFLLNWLRDKEEEDIHFSIADIPLTIGERGSFARQLLNNPVFTVAIEELKKEAIHLWESCGSDENVKREFLWKYIKALNQVKGRVERYVKDVLYQDSIDKRQSPEGEA